MRTLNAMWLAALLVAAASSAAEPIDIGVVDEMTGPNAEAGVLVLHGARLATSFGLGQCFPAKGECDDG